MIFLGGGGVWKRVSGFGGGVWCEKGKFWGFGGGWVGVVWMGWSVIGKGKGKRGGVEDGGEDGGKGG